MSENTDPNRVFDEIQFADNSVPGWWLPAFACTALFSVVYWVFYHGGAEQRTKEDLYGIALAQNTSLRFATMGELKPDEPTLLRNMAMANRVRVGAVVFRSKCGSCHGSKGEGKVGPNLTDEHYKHIKTVEDIAKVVSNGAGGNAMPAWGSKLHPNEIVLVSAYVASLRGQNLDGGKGPEGRTIDPWPDPPPPEETVEQ